MNDYGNNDFTRIQSRANIVEIISSYVNLERHGKNYFGVCPFHDDHSPSMSVSEDKQIYKCFVCGASGNVFNFVANYLNITFLEAVKIVADKVGENFTIKENRQDTKYAKYYEIMNISKLLYENNLRTKDGNDARVYLHDRGITDEIIKDFGIGLALPINNQLYKLLYSKGISENDMSKLGLISTNDNGVFDLFRNRIMFPLFSPSGKVNGYSGRIYHGEDASKYINTKETEIFKKRENLYNYHLAAPNARKEKFIVICEGFMDAIRIYSIGIKNVVATMGTALAKEQIDLLKKLGCKVIVTMDNDSAGELATVSIGKSLMQAGIDVGVVRLTGKKDPDEYILEYGATAFKENLKSPLSYTDFMDVYLRKNKNLGNPTELTLYINETINMLADLNDELLSEITINKLVDEFHLDKDLLKSRVKSREQLEEVKVEIKEKDESQEKLNENKYNRALKVMLYYMMNNTECMRLFLHYQLRLLKNKYRLVANNLIYYFELKREIDFADYLTFTENYPDVCEVVKEIIKDVSVSTFKEEDMESLISIVKGILDKERIKVLKEELKHELDINKKKRICEEIIEIKKGCVKNG